MAKILIIEDDPYVRRAYQKLFADKYDLEMAFNGEIGLDQARTSMPTLILLDINMPRMNGLEVLKALKADEQTKNIPIVMLTNIQEEDIIKSAIQLGAAGYIAKSEFTPEQVMEEINKHLDK